MTTSIKDTEALWSSKFGDQYTSRNRVDWQARLPLWRDVLAETQARSICEVGANAGWNLKAIKAASPACRVAGVDVNAGAVAEARGQLLDVRVGSASRLPFRDGEFDACFTAGVLIHVPPSDLATVMREIARISRRWILAVEYHADEETVVEYRGEPAALWKRNYAAAYLANVPGLTLVREWEAPSPAFDRCTATLLRKGEE